MDHGLVIVPAGAGAGKTHRIKSQLSDWVKAGTVRPERILAVTFTEAAAAELRERIRAGLLADGLVTEAMAVERAYVSTIHGLGLRLLTEHAFAAGASPQPRHLGDAERDLLIRQALAHAKALDPIKQDPARYGYAPNFWQGQSTEDSLRGRVLSMIELLRALGDKGRDPALIAPALARLDRVYGKLAGDAQSLATKLQAAVDVMLNAFPEGGAATVTAKTNIEKLEKNLAAFQKVQADPTVLDHDWPLWETLRHLFTSNRSSKTPDGYDALAEAIIEAADVLPHHPGPLADAKLHLQCLIACAQEVMAAYEARKKALGLIDFADMITGAERLLREHPDVRDAVLGEIDCVIIDEFQDTNPVQFALLWQLASKAPRTLLVGDTKQSIMGFQGADPRLSQALADANPLSLQPLERNWRSTPAVMEFVNAMGAGLFGASYTPLQATRAPVEGPALELLRLSNSRGTRKHSKPQEHIAERIAKILQNGEAITDRHSKSARPARPSDVALLVCRHTTAAKYAEEFRARGVPVRISEEGWACAGVVQAARAALAYAANPSDAHAGLMLRTLGPAPLDLEEALSAQMDGALADDPVLMALAGLSDKIAALPVSAALDLVLQAAGLQDWAEAQSDPAQARADLLRLQAEALDFEAAHRDLKAASGFHGETIKVFLGWLSARAGEKDFDRRPDPSGNGAEAVEIVTWHASKGREWPITVVAEFDNAIEERAWTTSTCFDALERIDDMGKVMASAALVHTPEFAADEATRRFIEDRRPDFEANAKNLLYVALTRARDRLVLEWPDFLGERPEENRAAKCLFHVFEDCCKPQVKTDHLQFSDIRCAMKAVVLPEDAGFTEFKQGEIALAPCYGPAAPLPPVALTPWKLQPSQTGTANPAPETQGIAIGDPWPFAVNDATRGTALHLALRCYLARPDLAENLAQASGLDPALLELTAARAAALKAWLEAQGYTELHCEIPVLNVTEEGTEMPGTIDLVALSPDGCLLIDHKSGGVGEGFGPYWPQLSSYGRLLAGLYPQHPLKAVAVFWIDHGRLELADEVAPAGAYAQTGVN